MDTEAQRPAGHGVIGARLTQALKFKEWGQAGLALIVVVLGTIAVDIISGAIRRRIISGSERRGPQSIHLVVDSALH